MGKYAKWIGGGLGWALGGPIGALIGFGIGSFLDSAEVQFQSGSGGSGASARMGGTGHGDFAVSLLVLSAAVMKADGKVLKSELDYVKKFFSQQFGKEKTLELMGVLKGLLDQEINLEQVGRQIKSNMQLHYRIQLIHYLFGIAHADGHISPVEVDTIERISRVLGISRADFQSVAAMFLRKSSGTSTSSAYKILEITSDATDTEVKDAYRKMAKKHHPDRFASLGPEMQNQAKEKFQSIQDAYETIKKQRGMK